MLVGPYKLDLGTHCCKEVAQVSDLEDARHDSDYFEARPSFYSVLTR